MIHFAQRLAAAADTVEELNARTDSGPKAGWTVADLQDAAGSFAAEEHVNGTCPVCVQTVMANNNGCIAIHLDKMGRTCVACGFSFVVAL